MALISFDENKKRDVVLIGRVTLDFNPNELNRTLDKVKTFSMYLGGSPGNMAVGINKLGKKVGFIGCVSDDQFGDFVLNYFNERGIDTSQMTRAKNGERMGLTFTEIKSPTESSILMYRDQVADLEIAPEDVDEQYRPVCKEAQHARHLRYRLPSVQLAQQERHPDLLLAAREHGGCHHRLPR